MNDQTSSIGDIKHVLHVGCGLEKIHPAFQESPWQETRLDIDPEVSPDIIASITDMTAVPTESVEAIYSSHNLEHLFAHEVPLALSEMLRVLKSTGFAIIGVPNLQTIAERIAADQLTEPAYSSPAGPIAPIDMLYGYRPFLIDNPFMAHRTGFTPKTLSEALVQANFGAVSTFCDTSYNLWAKAFKSIPSQEALDTPLWDTIL